jgi:UDP-N-acetylglucosamine--N-acetylmuramyl-(pentapeptide) pyrophosphoryl-undecaprenol N-acetylglucosamine transferase
MQPDEIRIIISGGGTGGHVFPAIAIANALKAKQPGVKILFVGALGKMEMEKVPAAGYPIIGLNIAGLQRRLTLKNLSFPFKVLAATWNAGKIIRDFKPHVAVGVGGYASGPLLRAASRNHVITVLQEQNSYPGITNKMLASKASRICVAYPGMERFFPKEKIILTGNPVRQDVVDLEGKRQRGLDFFGLKDGRKIVLVVGGSLGARTINESILNSLKSFPENKIQLLWQTGKSFAETAANAIDQMKVPGVKASAFITEMDLAYAVADVVVSRAGAIAISELCLVDKPVILVPSPNVAEDHQTKNAMALVNKGAALLVKDVDARENLVKEVIRLVRDEKQKEGLRRNILSLSYRDAANTIAQIILDLVNDNE